MRRTQLFVWLGQPSGAAAAVETRVAARLSARSVPQRPGPWRSLSQPAGVMAASCWVPSLSLHVAHRQVELYAEYDRPRLLSFLKTSSSYSLQKVGFVLVSGLRWDPRCVRGAT